MFDALLDALIAEAAGLMLYLMIGVYTLGFISGWVASRW